MIGAKSVQETEEHSGKQEHSFMVFRNAASSSQLAVPSSQLPVPAESYQLSAISFQLLAF